MPGKCVNCGGVAPLLCDASVGPGPKQTCDAPICRACAQSRRRFPAGTVCVLVTITEHGKRRRVNIADETIDYCPAHRQGAP